MCWLFNLLPIPFYSLGCKAKLSLPFEMLMINEWHKQKWDKGKSAVKIFQYLINYVLLDGIICGDKTQVTLKLSGSWKTMWGGALLAKQLPWEIKRCERNINVYAEFWLLCCFSCPKRDRKGKREWECVLYGNIHP